MIIEQFLVEAKVNTYASSGEGGEKNLEDGSKELVFEKEEFKYRDRYFGHNSFIGEEVVWENGKVVWGMNYYGRITETLTTEQETQFLQFLQNALRQVPETNPYRGPNKLEDGEFKYVNENTGTIEDFKGTETIFYQNKEIYRLNYNGGAVEK